MRKRQFKRLHPYSTGFPGSSNNRDDEHSGSSSTSVEGEKRETESGYSNESDEDFAGTVVVGARKTGRKDRKSSLRMAAERLDVLTALPSVYEPFTCRPYFFESPLRVPRSLTPAGYALETAVASELLQRGL